MISMNSLTIAAVSRVFAVYVPAYVIFRNDDAAGGLAACGCMGAYWLHHHCHHCFEYCIAGMGGERRQEPRDGFTGDVDDPGANHGIHRPDHLHSDASQG